MKVEDRFEYAIKNDIPFVLFCKPNSNKVNAIFQKDSSINYTTDFSEKGFVFAPFDDGKETFIIPFSIAEQFIIDKQSTIVDLESEPYNSVLEKEQKAHINLVQKGIDFINTSLVDKVVLSRKEVLKVDGFSAFETFDKLLSNYPTAFVYLWFHPKTGLWLGATPERLLSVDNNKFKVMALASTQVYKDSLNVSWGQKEQQEHQFVVDYITAQIKEYDLHVSETYTVKAGSLLHLRADISGEINNTNFSLKELINALHPTPAICGLPKDLAKKFILENENYNREYYTGFLGQINGDSTDLYVNLRCMKAEQLKNEVSVYVGGGVTINSNPENEWEETVAKSNIMKKVL